MVFGATNLSLRADEPGALARSGGRRRSRSGLGGVGRRAVASGARSDQLTAYAEKYGGGVENWRQLGLLLVPNLVDFNQHSTRPYPPFLYLYLGLPAIFAIVWAIRRREARPYLQALVPAAFCLLLATNPYYLVYRVIAKIPPLERVLQSYNFYEGVTAMMALVTAIAIDDFLTPAGRGDRAALDACYPALLAWAIGQR